MEPVLDLDPREGDLEFLEELQRTFEISLEQEHVAHWQTLGDIHQTLIGLVPPGSNEGVCPSAMAFRQMRSILVEWGYPRTAITPATPLTALARARPRRFFRRLARASALEFPGGQLTMPGNIGSCFIFFGFAATLALLLLGQWLAVAAGAAMVTVGMLLLRIDPGLLPRGVCTVGDLAECVAALNRAKFRAAGARQMPGDDWATLTAIAAEQSGLDAKELGPETYIFRKTYEGARSST